MKITRAASALLVILLTALLSGLTLAAPADAASTGRPKVGQCRTTTFAQGAGWSDTRKPVSCARVHRLKTFAVVDLPKRYNAKKASGATWNKVALESCTRRFWKAVAANHAVREQTAYTWALFIPTKSQRSAGARWIRCDLALQVTPPGQASQWKPLPNLSFPMVGTRPITDSIRRCYSDTTHRYLTTCDRAHAARADQTFVMNSTAFPSVQAVTPAAATNCPGKRFSTPYPRDWSFGDHVITCYSVTTS